MSLINYSSREINCKVVYYGSGLGGKTTNLEYVYSRVNPETKGKMISLATETERTLFFDFLPIDLGEIRGFRTRFHLYTVPGQVYATQPFVALLALEESVKLSEALQAGIDNHGNGSWHAIAAEFEAAAADIRATVPLTLESGDVPDRVYAADDIIGSLFDDKA